MYRLASEECPETPPGRTKETKRDKEPETVVGKEMTLGGEDRCRCREWHAGEQAASD